MLLQEGVERRTRVMDSVQLALDDCSEGAEPSGDAVGDELERPAVPTGDHQVGIRAAASRARGRRRLLEGGSASWPGQRRLARHLPANQADR